MLQALRAEALARQYSVNAELQRLDDMILTLENDVEEANAEANADVDMAEGSSGGRAEICFVLFFLLHSLLFYF